MSEEMDMDLLESLPPRLSNVYDCITAVTSAMARDGIAKSRKNISQNYAFRGIDDVYNSLSRELSSARLVITPTVLERQLTERESTKGGVLFYVLVKVRFTLTSAEDLSSVTVETFGEAMDSGDKATNKAMSAAYKYMAMQVFCIPTEGDNDADATTHEVLVAQPSRKSASQAKKDGSFDVFNAAINGATLPIEAATIWSEAPHDTWPTAWLEPTKDKVIDVFRSSLVMAGGEEANNWIREHDKALQILPLDWAEKLVQEAKDMRANWLKSQHEQP
jgi:hypothetical protein